ncbi:MAG TPA: ATP-binding protein [Ktedonobacteraceae bacterium]|nr:ATP-binding protein [Ktedonobacteraceae bacterium]
METKTQSFADIMLQHIPVGVALYEADSLHLLSANASFHRYMDTFLDPRWQGGKAIGHALQEWMPDTELASILTVFQRVAETGSPYRSDEYALYFPAHGTTYWRWTLEAIRDDDDRITQLLLTALDITGDVLARKRAEGSAQSSVREARLPAQPVQKQIDVIEAVAESVRESLEMKSISKTASEAIKAAFHPIFVSIHTADSAQEALRLLHLEYTGSEEVARALLQYVSYRSHDNRLIVARACEERRPIVIENVQEAVRSGQLNQQHAIVIFGAQSYVCIPLWFKDYFEGALSAAFDHTIAADGIEVQTLAACGTHIAGALAHARLHESVHSERARLRLILDRLPEAILITEAMDGSISYANEAAGYILGIPYKLLTGTQLHRYARNYAVTGLNERPGLPWYFAIIRSLSGEVINGQETIIIRPDGSKIFALSSSAPLVNEQNVITGAVTVFQDITAQKSLEQQKNEFLSIASHELRTPITSIQGFAEILQFKAAQGEPLDGASMRAINMITEQSQHLTQMIRDMLDLARVEQTQLQLTLAPHNILDTLSRVIESYTMRMYEHKLQWTLEGSADGKPLLCIYDEERIIQVLNNLLNNAIKYSPAGSKIEIGLRPAHQSSGRPHEVEIWVRDQGIGIAANELPKIFNRFYRASNLDSSFSGFGIGLFLVKEIITRHSGRVRAESSEGSGSTFFITLPLA